MKKLFLTLVSILLISNAYAENTGEMAKFTEGKQYLDLSAPPIESKGVTEYFSFYCPHCYSFYKGDLKTLKANLPEGTKFNPIHVDFISKNGAMLTKAFIASQVLKVQEKMDNEIFEYIHKQKKNFSNESDVRALFEKNGVDGAKFDAAMKSFITQNKMLTFKKKQDSIVRRYEKYYQSRNIKPKYGFGVPAVVVDDRYLINFEGLESPEQLPELVNYLLGLK